MNEINWFIIENLSDEELILQSDFEIHIPAKETILFKASGSIFKLLKGNMDLINFRVLS